MTVLLVVGIPLLIWCAVASTWVEDGLYAWIARRIRGRGWRAAFVAIGFHAGMLALAVLVGVAASAISSATGSVRSAAWLTVPVVAVGAPLVLALMPSRVGGFADLRQGLQSRGADEDEARTFAWTSGPFAFIELPLAIAAVLVPFGA